MSLNKLKERRASLEVLRCSKNERSQYKTVIEFIGDDDEVDIDWDTLEELLELGLDGIETLLQDMNDLELIEIYLEDQILV